MDITAVERELLGRILVSMKNGSLSIVKAKKLARQFVGSMPIDEEGLSRILDSLSDYYYEARAVYIKHVIPYKEEKRKEKVALATEFLRKGDIERALKVLKIEKVSPLSLSKG